MTPYYVFNPVRDFIQTFDKMIEKKFKIAAEDIQLLTTEKGGCYATDHITVDGFKVGYMYREKPEKKWDSGWRFFSGMEDQDYVDNAENLSIYNVNTIANYDPAIIPYLKLPIGSELERIEETEKFTLVNE